MADLYESKLSVGIQKQFTAMGYHLIKSALSKGTKEEWAHTGNDSKAAAANNPAKWILVYDTHPRTYMVVLYRSGNDGPVKSKVVTSVAALKQLLVLWNLTGELEGEEAY